MSQLLWFHRSSGGNYMDSPIKWVGGKSQTAKKICELIPVHDCYCEVFAGACWVFFNKEVSKVEVINDIFGELINFYRVLQRSGTSFIERSKFELYSKELYEEYKRDYSEGKHAEMNDVERAFRFYCMLRQAFSGRLGSGWGYSGTRNEAEVFFRALEGIEQITKRLKNVQIDCRDFEDVIEGFDGVDTLFFCDPPYINSDNSNYEFEGNSFSLHDHQRLYLKLKNIKGKFLLAIDDCEFIRERYCNSEFYVIENEVFYSGSDSESRKHVKELIIMNYNSLEMKKHVDYGQGKLAF